jgi:hypothetical protein
MSEWLAWLRTHETAMWWLAAASAVMFVASLILVPIILARIPHDYFLRKKRPRSRWADQHLLSRAVGVVFKNLLGLVLLAVGVVMLVLPGQGLLCMVAGVLLLDFPGKFNLERWLASRRPILRSINWIRRRANRPSLEMDVDLLRESQAASSDDRTHDA